MSEEAIKSSSLDRASPLSLSFIFSCSCCLMEHSSRTRSTALSHTPILAPSAGRLHSVLPLFFLFLPFVPSVLLPCVSAAICRTASLTLHCDSRRSLPLHAQQGTHFVSSNTGYARVAQIGGLRCTICSCK